jgi:cellulose synthase/poly-beta-1,6-N-acetylglucosamine synthase-like glycosyltransferase
LEPLFGPVIEEMFVAVFALAILVAIWIGYPIVVAVLARLRHRANGTWAGELPSVSVVLATRDGVDAVRRRVEDLLRADYPAERLEVLVCVDARVTRPEHLEAWAGSDRVRTIRGPIPGGKAVTLNAGVAASESTVLVFADTAQQFAGDAIRRLVDALAAPNVGAASGRLVIDTSAGGRRATLAEWYWSFERRLRRDEARLHSAVGVTGAIYAMWRERFVPMPAGLILDDLFTPMRLVLAGHRVAYVDDAIALEPRRFVIGEERRRKVRTLTGVWQLCRWMPGVLVPGRNPIWVQFVMHKLLRFASPLLVTIALAGLAATTWTTVAADPPRIRMVVLGGLGVVVLLLAVRPLRRVVGEFVQLNLALVQATVNGVRGNWNVW